MSHPGEGLLSEPETNSYVITVQLEDVKKSEALKIAEAIQCITDHENVCSGIAVAHVKFEA